MQRRIVTWALAIAGCVGQALASSNIDPEHSSAYGANMGWIEARGDGTNGAVVGTYYCTGYVWSANCGWIGMGNGPTNGWHYSNAAVGDWGVNHDGAGRLSGYAYGANIGWIAFEQTNGQPRIDLRTGALSGYAWSANAGWIGLTNAQAYVRTMTLDPGPDRDGDGLPDAWEYYRSGGTNLLSGGGHDADRDAAIDTAEYLADTDPLDPGDRLRIVSAVIAGSNDVVSWTSRPTRLYRLETTNSLAGAGGEWENSGPGLVGPQDASPMQAAAPSGAASSRFYRVRSYPPLAQ